MRTVVTTALAVATAVGVTLGVSSPAFADDGTAPACITRASGQNTDGKSFATVTNSCGHPMRVKVLWSIGFASSDCRPLAPGQSMTHRERLGHYARTVVC